MTDLCVLPDFDSDQAGQILERLFDIKGSLQVLNGERDLNFRVDTGNAHYVFKIANQDETYGMLECQHQVLQRLTAADVLRQQASSIESVNRRIIEIVTSNDGIDHFCRLLNYVEGDLLSSINPQSPELLSDLGKTLALLDDSMQNFNHSALERPLLWNMSDALATLERFKPLLDSDDKRQLIDYFEVHFHDTVLPLRQELRQGLIHNDANDNNVLVSGDSPWQQRVASIIDFGDMVHSWIAVEPAVAAAYAMLAKDKPLDAAVAIIKGYHAQLPLSEVEISVLFDFICMRLCMSVCICAWQRSIEPDNEYLSISERPAWALLEKLKNIPSSFAHYLFREACGLAPVPQTAALEQWLERHQAEFSPVVDIDLGKQPLLPLDTGVTGSSFGNPAEKQDMQVLSKQIFRQLEDSGCAAGIGRYAEYRLIYDNEAFIGADGHRRSLHLGIDIFMPAGSAVYAPLAATVFSVANHNAAYDYGGTLILQHRVEHQGQNIQFYTLYGHLAPGSMAGIKTGDKLDAGHQLACMGTLEENGHWPPHLHFEVITDLLDETDTFVGVGSHEYRNVWLNLCPNPNLILGIPAQSLATDKNDADQIIRARESGINPSLSLSYREPIVMARGAMQYLYDTSGHRYLDAVNNVPHVGHCHPWVVAAGVEQTGILNTNTRYLYDKLTRYSEKLLQKFPAELSVCYFTNSGSEANDLALRLARNFTERHDVVILDHAYHGNLSSLIDISPYKHDAKGGSGRPDHVHKACMPDTYRGEIKADATSPGESYSLSVNAALQAASVRGGAAAFICETLLGCGGQIVPPPNYLNSAYAHARNAGALCIADEVQVGFGRVGSHFWGFETQQVVPDIVTLGKPIGNGHPLAAVITRREIADSFNNGMEYFNTFGGNSVSCAIGLAVLAVIEAEQLQANALEVGNYLLDGLHRLQERFEIIGDVRGLGLFIGVELVRDRNSLMPAASQASYIAERMKQNGVLISTDGPLHNVLKIKPPLCFDQDNAGFLLERLESVLEENFAQRDRP